MSVDPSTVADVDQAAAEVRDRCDAAGIDLYDEQVRAAVLKMAVEVSDAVKGTAARDRCSAAWAQRNAALRVATAWLYALPETSR